MVSCRSRACPSRSRKRVRFRPCPGLLTGTADELLCRFAFFVVTDPTKLDHIGERDVPDERAMNRRPKHLEQPAGVCPSRFSSVKVLLVARREPRPAVPTSSLYPPPLALANTAGVCRGDSAVLPVLGDIRLADEARTRNRGQEPQQDPLRRSLSRTGECFLRCGKLSSMDEGADCWFVGLVQKSFCNSSSRHSKRLKRIDASEGGRIGTGLLDRSSLGTSL